MAIGIKNFFRNQTPIVVTSSTVRVPVNLAVEMKPFQAFNCYWWIPINTGAAGGVRALILLSSAVNDFRASYRLHNTVTGLISIKFDETSAAVFTNALASSGNHWLEIEAYIENGATLQTASLEMAQNSSNPASLTIKKGARLDTVLL